MQTILQSCAYHGQYRDTFHLMSTMGRQYGYREYYRGMSAVVMRNGCSNTIFFALREPLRRRFAHDDTSSKVRRFGAAFISGAILGGILSTLFYPLNVCKTRMQSKLGGPHRSIRTVFFEILIERHRSVRGLYRGVHLNFVRAILTWGLTNLIYDVAMHLITDVDRKQIFDTSDLLSKIEYNEEFNHWTWLLE